MISREQMRSEIEKSILLFLLSTITEMKQRNITVEYVSQDMKVSIKGNNVTIKDIEILLIVIFLSKEDFWNETVFAKCSTKEIAFLLSPFDAEEVFQSLNNIHSMTFDCTFGKLSVTSLCIHIIDWDKKNDELFMIVDRSFYHACKRLLSTICIYLKKKGGERYG